MSRIPMLFPPFTSPEAMIDSIYWTPLKDLLDVLALGGYGQRGVLCGIAFDIAATSTGVKTMSMGIPLAIPNAGNQVSAFTDTNGGGGAWVKQFRCYVQVSNAAIGVKPRIYDVDAAAYLTVSGDSFSSGIFDDFSGLGQVQTLIPSLPNATHSYLPKLEINGTPAAGYTARGIIVYDSYIDPDL